METVCQALIGNYLEEHVFALTQALELYDIYQTKVMACDKQIEAIEIAEGGGRGLAAQGPGKAAHPPGEEPIRRTLQPSTCAPHSMPSSVWT